MDTREKRDDRDYRDSSRESTLREPKEIRDGRERDRDVRERERDREGRDRERGRDFNSREKRRNSKPEVPVVPMVDHRSGEEKQRPRSSQEFKHPRSVALSGVVLPLLSEVLRESLLTYTRDERRRKRRNSIENLSRERE